MITLELLRTYLYKLIYRNLLFELSVAVGTVLDATHIRVLNLGILKIEDTRIQFYCWTSTGTHQEEVFLKHEALLYIFPDHVIISGTVS